MATNRQHFGDVRFAKMGYIKGMTTQERVLATLGLEADSATRPSIKALVEQGLPAQSFRSVAAAYGLSNRRLAALTHIPARTIDRRIAEHQKLRVDESDRLARVARIYAAAEELFRNKEAIERWLNAPNFALDGVKPIDELSTELGAREVEDTLAHIADGIPL
jgi:putative toxin-antitoxin system antitoxin component (TIGR02293 family)